MATYAIGDIHGCFRTFRALLGRISFDRRHDRLWLVGDLVNGGPDSLSVLRWAHQNDDRIMCVLGNHDIYLLARLWDASGIKKRDTLQEVLEAPDRQELIEWLRRRPLFVEEGSAAMVHAGLLPAWDLHEARRLCRPLEQVLRGPDAASFLESYFGVERECGAQGLKAEDKLCCALKALTLMRTCRRDGRLCLEFTGEPADAPPGCHPWYELCPADPVRTLYFGHWAALGFHRRPGFTALDSGCVWGGKLTAVRFEDQAVFQQPNIER